MRKIEFYYVKKHQILWCFFSFLLPLIVYFFIGIPLNFVFVLSNFLVILTASLLLAVRSNMPYSLEKMVYFFSLFFMGVIPVSDAVKQNLYWGGARVSDDTLVLTNFLILIALLSVFLGANFANFFSKVNNSLSAGLFRISRLDFGFFQMLCLLFFGLAVCFLIFKAAHFNLLVLLFRGVVTEDSGPPVSQIVWLVQEYYLRPMPIIIVLIYSVYFQNSNKRLGQKIVYLILFLLALVFVAPTSVARFMVAALYIPMILTFTSFWNKSYSMPLSILVSLLLIFPFLDKFRYFDPNNFEYSLNFSFLNTGHFDAYQNFSRVVELDLLTYGNQLLGALFFFVPRSFWMDKPIGSGAYLAQQANFNFSNVSMPFFGEGYINFGIVGLVVFCFLFGLLISMIDRKFWSRPLKDLFSRFYFMLFGLVFFMMRGDLMSSFSFFVGFTMSFFSVLLVFRFIFKKYVVIR